jgi:hypothetical protein
MDDKDFKKHLQDLVHGHHHPEEHDWAPGPDEKRAHAAGNVRRATVKTHRRTRKPSKRARKS